MIVHEDVLSTISRLHRQIIALGIEKLLRRRRLAGWVGRRDHEGVDVDIGADLARLTATGAAETAVPAPTMQE